MSHIFVSYATKDLPLVKPIQEGLQAQGITTWLTTMNVQSSENWIHEVDTAIQKASQCLLLLSPAALNSPAVAYEYRYCLSHKIPLILAIIEAIDYHKLPPSLQSFQVLDMTVDLEAQMTQLIDQLKTQPAANRIKPTQHSSFMPRSQVTVTVNLPQTTDDSDTSKFATLIGKLADLGIENIEVDESADV